MTTITAKPKQTYALIIGIDEYKDKSMNIQDQVSPVTDALGFANLLLEREVPPNQIYLCLSTLNKTLIESAQGKGMIPKEATYSNIKDTFENLFNMSGDLLFLYWVGHGFMGAEEDRRLLCADANPTAGWWHNFSVKKILDFFRSPKFKISNQICLIEACSTDERGLPPNQDPIPLDIPPITRFENRNYAQFVLYAALEGKVANVGMFFEKIKEEFDRQPHTNWPPNMLTVAEGVRKSFWQANLAKKPGQKEQIQPWKVQQMSKYLWRRSWDQDEDYLYPPVNRTPTICICGSNKFPEYINLISEKLEKSPDGCARKILNLNCYDWVSNEKWKEELSNVVIFLCLIAEDYLNQEFIVENKSDHMIRVRELKPLYESGKNKVIPIYFENPNESEDSKELSEWLRKLPLANISEELPTHLKMNDKNKIDLTINDIAKNIEEKLGEWNSSTYHYQNSVPFISKHDNSIPADLKFFNTVIGCKNALNVFKELDNYLSSPDKANFVVLHGMPGTGKYLILKAWLAHLELKNCLGVDHIFTWSFHPQITKEQANIESNIESADELMKAALDFFSDADEQKDYIGNLQQGYKLAEKIKNIQVKSKYKSSLLVIYGLEELQEKEEINRGQITDQSLRLLLEEVAKDDNTLCIIATSIRLKEPEHKKIKEIDLDKQEYKITVDDWEQIGKNLNLAQENHKNWCLIYEDFKDIYSLNLIKSLITGGEKIEIDAFRKYYSDKSITKEIDKILEFIDNEFDKDDQKKKLLTVLKVMTLFRRRVKLVDLKNLIHHLKELPGFEISDKDIKNGIEKLNNLELVYKPMGFIEIHPVVSNYFKERLEKSLEGKEILRKGYLYLYYHFGYSHLCDPVIENEYKPTTCNYNISKPVNISTLAELIPLYDSVYYGFMATKYPIQGDQKDIDIDKLWDYFWTNIRCKYDHKPGNDVGCWSKDLAALDLFFDRRWDQPNNLLLRINQAHVLNEAGFDLRSLSQLEAAIIPFQKALNIILTSDEQIENKKWLLASLASGNLAKTYVSLGKIYDAMDYAHSCVPYADKSLEEGNLCEVNQVIWTIETRVWLGEVLSMAGRFWESEAAFNRAKEISKETSRGELKNQAHYRYCRLLLDQAKFVAKGWVQNSSITLTTITCGIDNCSFNNCNCCRVDDPVLRRLCQIEQLTNYISNIQQSEFSNEMDKIRYGRNNRLVNGLYNLTIGRSLLLKCEYLILLKSKEIENIEIRNIQSGELLLAAEKAMTQAWSDLEAVGHQIYMAECLLGLSDLFRKQGIYQKIASKFDDAEKQLLYMLEIATRGNMKLFEADYHLELAYLYWDKHQTFPERGQRRMAILNLTDAESIILETGYGRRLYEVLELRKEIFATFTNIPKG